MSLERYTMSLTERLDEQRRNDIDKLWDVLGYGQEKFDSQDKDVYTLAVEAIEERNRLRAIWDGSNDSITFMGDRRNMYRGALAIITRLARGFKMPPLGPNYWVPLDNRLGAILDVAEKTLEGKYR